MAGFVLEASAARRFFFRTSHGLGALVDRISQTPYGRPHDHELPRVSDMVKAEVTATNELIAALQQTLSEMMTQEFAQQRAEQEALSSMVSALAQKVHELQAQGSGAQDS